MKVSIVIVSYNAKDYLQFCLESCVKAIELVDAEIIVIDNNSSDQEIKSLQEIFPQVAFYFLEQNIGFSKANNFGVEKAKGEYVLILNPDTILPEDILPELLSFYNQQKNIGFLGVKLIDANGNFHQESKRNLPTPINSIFKLLQLNHLINEAYYNNSLNEDEIGSTKILVGAFMFTLKNRFYEVNGFDSRYFMFGEDIDISYSMELAGYTNFYNGELVVMHYKGKSTKVNFRYFKIFYDAMNQFVKKYYGNQFLKLSFLRLGIWISYLFASFKAIIFTFKRTKSTVKKNELYWLKESLELNSLEEKHLVLSTSIFSYKEILRIIAQNNSPQIFYYIHSHYSDKIIGYNGLIK